MSMDRERLRNIANPMLDSLVALYGFLRSYFFTGLILVVPMVVTIYVMLWIFTYADGILGNALREALGYSIPGVGLISTGLVLVFAGMLAQNIIGSRLLKWIDFSLESLPVVRSLYIGVKQVSDVLFQKQQGEFQRVVMVEYPKEDSWVLGFVTGDFSGSTASPPLPSLMVCVFVPTTPNPTSGFLLILEKRKIRDTNLGIEEAMKMIISGGLVRPGNLSGTAVALPAAEDFTIPH
ncbi:MAG: DUF502 domain-containing protein [Candidatus Riflebacteria bacterium]|nr:DUF502 domain-containing protein [Candidatus Riflebacteria bacterium]